MENQTQNFEETLAMYRSAFRRGDMTRIADKVGCHRNQITRMLKKKSVIEMTNTEKEILKVCQEEFKSRFKEARELESDATRITQG